MISFLPVLFSAQALLSILALLSAPGTSIADVTVLPAPTGSLLLYLQEPTEISGSPSSEQLALPIMNSAIAVSSVEELEREEQTRASDNEDTPEYWAQQANDRLAGMPFMHAGSLLLVVVSAMVSLPCIVLLFLWRDYFPLHGFNVPLLIIQESLMPFAVWGGLMPIVSPHAPCWVALLLENVGLFPTICMVWYFAVKLWSEYNFSLAMARGNFSHSSVRYRRLWNKRTFAIFLVLACFCITWANTVGKSLLASASTPSGALLKSSMRPQCQLWTDGMRVLNIVEYSVFPLGSALTCLLGLHSVDDAFGLKRRLLRASVSFLCANALYGTGMFLAKFMATDVHVQVEAASTFAYSLGLHLYSWFLPVSTLKACREYSNKMAKHKPAIMLLLSSVAEYPHPPSVPLAVPHLAVPISAVSPLPPTSHSPKTEIVTSITTGNRNTTTRATQEHFVWAPLQPSRASKSPRMSSQTKLKGDTDQRFGAGEVPDNDQSKERQRAKKLSRVTNFGNSLLKSHLKTSSGHDLAGMTERGGSVKKLSSHSAHKIFTGNKLTSVERRGASGKKTSINMTRKSTTRDLKKSESFHYGKRTQTQDPSTAEVKKARSSIVKTESLKGVRGEARGSISILTSPTPALPLAAPELNSVKFLQPAKKSIYTLTGAVRKQQDEMLLLAAAMNPPDPRLLIAAGGEMGSKVPTPARPIVHAMSSLEDICKRTSSKVGERTESVRGSSMLYKRNQSTNRHPIGLRRILFQSETYLALFRDYMVRELCVENVLYTIKSYAFQLSENIEERMKMSDQIYAMHFRNNCLLPLTSLKATTRRAILDSFVEDESDSTGAEKESQRGHVRRRDRERDSSASQGWTFGVSQRLRSNRKVGEVGFWDAVDAEIDLCLLTPFFRFQLYANYFPQLPVTSPARTKGQSQSGSFEGVKKLAHVLTSPGAPSSSFIEPISPVSVEQGKCPNPPPVLRYSIGSSAFQPPGDSGVDTTATFRDTTGGAGALHGDTNTTSVIAFGGMSDIDHNSPPASLGRLHA